MKGVKQTTTEIITIEEAIHDYKQSYKDYQETITKANKFLENDKDVIKTILRTYFPASEVDVNGTVITLTYGYDRPFLTKNFKENLDSISKKYTIKMEEYSMVIYLDIEDVKE